MLSLYSTELGRRTTWTCLSCSALARTPPSWTSIHQRSARGSHARRNSSSKASNSSKQYAGALSTAADADKKSLTPESSTKPPETIESLETRTSPLSRKKSRNAEHDGQSKADYQAAQPSLPRVPSTQNVHPWGIHLATFFSTHRPVSISDPLPPPSSDSAFSSLFEPTRSPKSSEVIHTLSSAVDRLENAAYDAQQGVYQRSTPEELDLRTAVAAASESPNTFPAQNIDLPAKTFTIDLQELAKQLRPYSPPPPPVPLAALEEAAGADARDTKRDNRLADRKSYKTTLTIYENTYANGKRAYETRSTPLVIKSLPKPSTRRVLALPKPVEVRSADEQDSDSFSQEPETSALVHTNSPTRPPSHPFLSRMYRRQVLHFQRMDQRLNGPHSDKDLDYASTSSVPTPSINEPHTATAPPPMEDSEVTAEDTIGEGEAGKTTLWQLISVKRQRKLKMKKHKYKKLMKKTKNLRRRLDRQ